MEYRNARVRAAVAMGDRGSGSERHAGQTTFVGVDVGTSSARAGVFDEEGHLIGHSSCPIQMWKEAGCIEQSSTDIWHAICSAVHGACRFAGVQAEDVKGIGFDATCSLVALGSDDQPVTVSHSGDTRRNVIVWMDHRAVQQADRINASDSPVLQFVGGRISPEMQPPKLLWVKENLPDSWTLAFRWMDLGDFLTYRATGDDTRSLCTTVCKWTYLGHAHAGHVGEEGAMAMEALGWDGVFWEEIGLGDVVEGAFSKIGRSVAVPGYALGSGLTFSAAQELGLMPGTPVSTALIDAHAGGVGTMESVPRNIPKTKNLQKAKAKENDEDDEIDDNGGASGKGERETSGRRRGSVGEEGERGVALEKEREREREEEWEEVSVEVDDEEAVTQRLVLVCGTSSCHMAVSKEKIFVPGVWGPYWSAMIPNLWLTEGGQSATGALLDHLLNGHVAAEGLANRAAAMGESVYAILNSSLSQIAAEKELPFVAALTKDLHVLPDFHGNRSPFSDPVSKGVLCGLSLDTSEESLALLYLATIQGIAYGTRQIIEHCNANGHKINTIIACGGLAKNRRYLEEHANITGCDVVLPRESEPVLLGAAILGAVAARRYGSVREGMRAMNAVGQVVRPEGNAKLKQYHEAKYSVFKALYTHQKEYQATMADGVSS